MIRLAIREPWEREIDEEPIAEILGDVAAPAGHGAGGVVARQDVAPVFRVEPHRERRRADEIAEEDRQLATLAGACDGGFGGRLSRQAWRGLPLRYRQPTLRAEPRGRRHVRLAA